MTRKNDRLREAVKRGRKGLIEIEGVMVLEGEGGRRFYHKHMSPKAQARKKKRKVNAKKAKRRNR